MGFEKEYLITKIYKMSDEEIKDFLFSIRWGFLSLDFLTEKRKLEEKHFNSYLKTLQLSYVLDKTKLSEAERIEVAKYEEKIKLLRFLEKESEKNATEY